MYSVICSLDVSLSRVPSTGVLIALQNFAGEGAPHRVVALVQASESLLLARNGSDQGTVLSG